jgi:cell division protein FtsI (penicillin-binding protein 3)
MVAKTPRRSKPAKADIKVKQRNTSAVEIAVWRYWLVMAVFVGLFAGLLVRAVYLQVIDAEYLQDQGKARFMRIQKEMPTRGMIIDRNEQPLAISTPVSSLWVHPPTILKQKQEYSYKKLGDYLGMSREQFLAKVEGKKDKEFMYLKRHLPPAQADQVLALGIPGVNAVREYRRYYPAGPVLGHVLGFTNIDNEGQEGLELAFNDVLKGRQGRNIVMRDKYGHVIDSVERIEPVEHGKHVQLTIDARIQYLAYRYLQAAVKKHRASSGSLVALDVNTGEILAMVNAPDFNPNNRSELQGHRFRNRAITDIFEPGSTVKPFSVAMALQEKVITENTVIDTSPGIMYIGNHSIRDTSNHEALTVSEVIKKSSNIGSAKIAMKMPAKSLYNTYADLGFGKTNDLKLYGEQKGILAKRKKWRPVEHATLSYGYGLSVTALQLARAYQGLANNGELLPVSLYLGQQQGKAGLSERVFDAGVAKSMHAMMESVVSSEGTAPLAQVKGYRVAGKTGTAHRIVDGQYQDDSYLSLFAGFAPVSNPRVAMVVVIDDPKGVDYYGGKVAAPVFSDVMNGALRLLEVAPDKIQLPSDIETDEPQLQIHRPEQFGSNPKPDSALYELNEGLG